MGLEGLWTTCGCLIGWGCWAEGASGAGLARGAGAAGRVGAPTGLERCRRFSGGGTGWAAPVAATSGPAFMLSGLQVERRRVMLGQDIGNGMQMSLAAFGTQRWIDALTGEEVVDVGDVGLGRIGEAEEGATLHQALLTLAVDEKAVEADTMETRRQHMAEETADELLGGQAHALVLAVAVVKIAEGHAAVVDPFDPVVGNGNAVDVTTEVAQQDLWFGEGAFGVDHPRVPIQGLAQRLPTTRLL